MDDKCLNLMALIEQDPPRFELISFCNCHELPSSVFHNASKRGIKRQKLVPISVWCKLWYLHIMKIDRRSQYYWQNSATWKKTKKKKRLSKSVGNFLKHEEIVFVRFREILSCLRWCIEKISSKGNGLEDLIRNNFHIAVPQASQKIKD